MGIRRAESYDMASIATLHAESITTGFLSKLGIPFLVELYRAINRQTDACLLVVEDAGMVQGFVAGTTDIGPFYRVLLIHNWYRFVLPLLRFAINPVALAKIFETIRYGLKEKSSNVDYSPYHAELLSISVHHAAQGRGFGKALVYALEMFYKTNDIISYKVVTFAHDEKSNGFYTSCNFTLHTQFMHHGNTMNEYGKSLI